MTKDFQILCIPGGFSYGDDVATGRILANQMRNHLADLMQEFKASDKLLLGICNGFQVLIKSGILLDDNENGDPPATLCWNDHGRYEDRWVHLKTTSDKCVFLRGLEQIYLPIAHAEGRFVMDGEQVAASLVSNGQLALAYTTPAGEDATGFPDNPNGAELNVAGVCDTSGRVFGLMPHPERFIDGTQHPRWTKALAWPFFVTPLSISRRSTSAVSRRIRKPLTCEVDGAGNTNGFRNCRRRT